MPSVPQGAYAVLKLRSKPNDMMIARVKNGDEKAQNFFSNDTVNALSPVKYNSKLMKSIWGLYNRYSPHNIKKNNAKGEGELIFEQQLHVVAAYAISEKLEMAKNGDIWKFPL